ncbi:hypothetical protein [Leifsonia poae]|uniref:hypothetical protein n=1 Tax=Leifsonia poae TaxID=110933 RepID=UPI003D66870D
MTATTSRTTTARPARTTSFDRLGTTTWIDVAVILTLSVLAVLGFEPAFGHFSFVLAAFGGLVVGGGAAIACRLLRLSVPISIAIALAAYFVFGTPLAMPAQATLVVLPSLDSLSGLVIGAVFGWSDAVTLQAPLEAPPYVAVVPYFASWLVALVSVTLAVRWLPSARDRSVGRPAVLLTGPILLFLAGILLGTSDPYFAGVRGVLFGAIALLWLGWRRRRVGGVESVVDPGLRRRRLVGTGAVVLGAVAVGAVAGSLLAPPADSRFVLRQEVTPPFDPLDYPSPSPVSASTRKTWRRRSSSPPKV